METRQGVVNEKLFPEIPHLPWSENKSSGDEILKDLSIFHEEHVAVTEKIPGETIVWTQSDGYRLHGKKNNGQLYIFAIFDQNNTLLPWARIEIMCRDLKLSTVPVLYRGLWDEEKVKDCYEGQEGYIVRISYPIACPERVFYNIAKFIRKT